MAAFSFARTSSMCTDELKVGVLRRVDLGERRVAVLRDVGAVLPVEKYDESREPGLTAAAAATAFWMPVCFVTSPSLWKTATSGACSPVPKVFSVRWFAS